MVRLATGLPHRSITATAMCLSFRSTPTQPADADVITAAGCSSTESDGVPTAIFAHKAPGNGSIAGNGGPKIIVTIADLHGNLKVRFPGLSLHSIRYPEIQKTLAGGIHDELARLVPEGFLRGSDHHELTASGGAPGCKPLSMIGKPVLCEMVLSIEQLSAAEAKSPGAIFDVSSTVLDPKLEAVPQTLLLVHYESI